MLSLVIFITAAVLLNGVFCRPSQELDIDAILEILQAQNELSQRGGDRASSSSDSDSSDDDNRYTLRNSDLAKLVQDVSNTDRLKIGLYRHVDGTNRYKYKKNRAVQDFKNEYTVGDRDEEYSRYDERNQDDKKSLEQVLEELLSKNLLNKKSLAKQRKQKLLPSTLLDSLYRGKNDDYTGNLNQYSKIFVVLNPRALETSKNKNKLADLVSRIVSASALNEDKGLLKEQKNRGSNLFARRFRRDSKEMYGGKDSMEDDYKPKRYRNDRGGGGGGGRTAIPYIRQRGDIYERS